MKRICLTSHLVFWCFQILAVGGTMAQCNTQVTHGSGTLLVGGSNITVTASGQTNLYNSYCPAVTSPYFIGYNFSTGSGSGRFQFNFSPAVSGLRLNFSGASNTGTDVEEIRLTVNGAHYAMPSAGSANGCDPMATLTGAGDLRGCVGCGVSGWSNTSISASISSLIVEDFVVGGSPNGSLFSLYICNVILPAEWLHFAATSSESGGVDLEWTTDQEVNNDYFIVERSQDGEDWISIAEEDAVGNSNGPTDYSYRDLQPGATGFVHYRIRQVNMDGSGSNSDVQTVYLNSGNGFAVFPNPADETASLFLPEGAEVSDIQIFNNLGQIVPVSIVKSGQRVELNLAELPAGFYMLQMMVSGNKMVQKLQVR